MNAYTQQLALAIKAVAEKKVVIYPTETVYGLGCLPTCEEALRHIYRIKKRALTNPLPLIGADLSDVLKVVKIWPSLAARLSEEFWPGPLTLVLPCKETLSPLVHAGTGRVAIRVSSHPVAQALASGVGGVLVATSANISGSPPCGSPDELPRELTDNVDIIIDVGKLPEQLPSTVIALKGQLLDQIEIIREGAIPREKLLRLL